MVYDDKSRYSILIYIFIINESVSSDFYSMIVTYRITGYPDYSPGFFHWFHPLRAGLSRAHAEFF